MLYDIIHCIGWVKVECATSGVTAAPATAAAAAAAVALTIQSQAGAMSGAAAVAAGASNTVPRHSA